MQYYYANYNNIMQISIFELTSSNTINNIINILLRIETMIVVVD